MRALSVGVGTDAHAIALRARQKLNDAKLKVTSLYLSPNVTNPERL